MRIAIFSDSHGRMHNCFLAMEKAGHIDHILHLGDNARDAEDLGIAFPDIPITFVCGNCDFCAGGAYEKTVELGGKQLFLCHGHTRNVKNNLRELAAFAKSADLVLFGHTHEQFSDTVSDVPLFNPGSIALPASGAPSFGILTIESGVIKTEHRTL